MLTYNHILSSTPGDVRKRSKAVTVSITSAQAIEFGGKKGVKFVAEGRAATEKVYYAVEIEMYPEKIKEKDGKTSFEDVGPNTECRVSCTCPYQTYHFEWVLWKNGSGPRRQATNKPPHITNPDMIPGVCKHLFKAMPLALRALSKIGKK